MGSVTEDVRRYGACIFIYPCPRAGRAGEENGVHFTLVAGEGYGRQSPVPVYSELFMIQVKSREKTALNIEGKLRGEIGICVVEGYIEACDERIDKGNLLVSKEEDTCHLVIGEDTHLLLFGGKPFEEERFIYWNFVASEEEKIEDAKRRWANREFEMVPGGEGVYSFAKGGGVVLSFES